jgi:protein disulfide-isomerase A1
LFLFSALKVFRASGDIEKPAEYQGGRSDKDIIKYLRKQVEPAYVTISTDAELDSFDDKDGVEILGVFASLESDEAKTFLKAAEELRNDYSFGISTNAEFATKFGASVPALVLFKSEGGVEQQVATSEAAKLASVAAQKEWIQAEAFALVGEIGPENFQAC